MEQLKIVETDYNQKGAASMADNPITAGMGAADIKERFDSLVRELVAVRFNAVIDLLMSDVPLQSGADQIHAPTIEDVTGNAVAEQLASINSRLSDCVDAAIPDGAVTAFVVVPESLRVATSPMSTIARAQFFPVGITPTTKLFTFIVISPLAFTRLPLVTSRSSAQKTFENVDEPFTSVFPFRTISSVITAEAAFSPTTFIL